MDENFNKREQEVEDQPDVDHLDVGIIKVSFRSNQHSSCDAVISAQTNDLVTLLSN